MVRVKIDCDEVINGQLVPFASSVVTNRSQRTYFCDAEDGG